MYSIKCPQIFLKFKGLFSETEKKRYLDIWMRWLVLLPANQICCSVDQHLQCLWQLEGETNLKVTTYVKVRLKKPRKTTGMMCSTVVIYGTLASQYPSRSHAS